MNRCVIKLALVLLLLVVVGCYLLLFIAYPPKATPKPETRNLIILVSGFGEHQLQHLVSTPDGGFARLVAGDHSTVGYPQPIFPALTQPNWYTMMTGMYPEQHGVVGDIVYSPEHGIVIDPVAEKNVDQLKLNPMAKFLWEETEFQEKKHQFFVDPCSNVPWLKTKRVCDAKMAKRTAPTPQAKLEEFDRNLQTALTQLHKGELSVAIVHTSAIYELSTMFGPLNDVTKASLKSLDDAVKRLLEKIAELKYADHLNVIVASDHGMASIEKAKQVVLDDIINYVSVLKIVSQGTYSGIWTAPGQRDSVYSKLKNITGIHVWTKDDIPWDFHFKNNDYIAPIQIVASKGYFIHFQEDNELVVFPENLKSIEHPQGCEGYDPREVEDMRAVYVASGPAFPMAMPSPMLTKDFYAMTRSLFAAPKPAGEEMKMDMGMDMGMEKKPAEHHHH